MRSLIVLLLIIFSTFSTAQVPDHLKEKSDTVEIIDSDTSVVYIIQEEPITIVEKVMVLKPKANYFFSIHLGLTHFSEYEKALSGYEEYLIKVEQATKNKLGYMLTTSLWKCPKNIYISYTFGYTRLVQKFEAQSISGESTSSYNYFNYMGGGVNTGYCFKKQSKFSCILYGGITLDNLLSYSAFTLQKKNPLLVKQLKSEIKLREYILHVTIGSKIMFNTKNILLEAEPFFSFTPLSASVQKEVYSIHRILIGLKMGISNKMF